MAKGDATRSLEFETSEDVDSVGSFDAMGLKDELLRGLYAYGALLCPSAALHQPRCALRLPSLDPWL